MTRVRVKFMSKPRTDVCCFAEKKIRTLEKEKEQSVDEAPHVIEEREKKLEHLEKQRRYAHRTTPFCAD